MEGGTERQRTTSASQSFSHVGPEIKLRPSDLAALSQLRGPISLMAVIFVPLKSQRL